MGGIELRVTPVIRMPLDGRTEGAGRRDAGANAPVPGGHQLGHRERGGEIAPGAGDRGDRYAGALDDVVLVEAEASTANATTAQRTSGAGCSDVQFRPGSRTSPWWEWHAVQLRCGGSADERALATHEEHGATALGERRLEGHPDSPDRSIEISGSEAVGGHAGTERIGGGESAGGQRRRQGGRAAHAPMIHLRSV